ncbi:MAG TPA: amidohydrolase [Chthoniobacterales bacterium]
MRTFLFFIALLSLPLGGKAETADTIFLNGNVYTVNEAAPTAQAIAIKGERILFAGTNEDAKKFAGPSTRTIDLKGKTVVPGLTDSHYHILGVGERLTHLNMESATSREKFLAMIKEQAAKTAAGRWITGRGWIETFWKPPVFPTRQDLDKVAPDNPAFLTRADGHGAVANSKAFEMAGIDAKTPNPFGGEILRDKKSGEPLGMLLDNAIELVEKKIPPPTAEENANALILGAKRSIELGWCEIQNAGSQLPEFELLQKLYRAGKLKLRIYNAVYGPGPASEHLLKNGPILDAYDNHFTTRTIKVIFDGSLGSRSAALLEPYSDADTSGFLTEKEENLRPMLKEALRRGIQVETHAIGDRANRTILDLYEEAFNAVPPNERKVKEPRWRVEHAQILSAQDVPRFAKLGVIASMQPSHAISDLFFAPRRLGEKRLAGAYAWQSLLKSGAIIAAGSDAPVELGEPMIEFYAAVARKSKDGFSGPGWHPEQAVTREQALKMLTAWPAVAAFQEKEKGSIEAGKLADLTILSDDIMKIPAPEILHTRCLMTVVGGEVAFDAGEIAGQ